MAEEQRGPHEGCRDCRGCEKHKRVSDDGEIPMTVRHDQHIQIEDVTGDGTG